MFGANVFQGRECVQITDPGELDLALEIIVTKFRFKYQLRIFFYSYRRQQPTATVTIGRRSAPDAPNAGQGEGRGVHPWGRRGVLGRRGTQSRAGHAELERHVPSVQAAQVRHRVGPTIGSRHQIPLRNITGEKIFDQELFCLRLNVFEG